MVEQTLSGEQEPTSTKKKRTRKTREEEAEDGSRHVDVVYDDEWVAILDSYKAKMGVTSRGEVVRSITRRYHDIAAHIDPSKNLIFLVVYPDDKILYRMPANFFLR